MLFVKNVRENIVSFGTKFLDSMGYVASLLLLFISACLKYTQTSSNLQKKKTRIQMQT